MVRNKVGPSEAQVLVPPPYLTIPQVGLYFGIRPDKVRDHIYAGDFHASKGKGKAYRIETASIYEYLKSTRVRVADLSAVAL